MKIVDCTVDRPLKPYNYHKTSDHHGHTTTMDYLYHWPQWTYNYQTTIEHHWQQLPQDTDTPLTQTTMHHHGHTTTTDYHIPPWTHNHHRLPSTTTTDYHPPPWTHNNHRVPFISFFILRVLCCRILIFSVYVYVQIHQHKQASLDGLRCCLTCCL